ncbi:unnamed protein product [Bursaphelenchus xylophilus]|uniref:(pine wood nematode) hypothetical protein n=1 Tax=Bursaphelenchus xylophilus TaxID=6326 RepID=A0A1I7SQW7_BURXY|nr:unnamed protein product [Bursaphelenchus xylophilus]CAG9110491.1 unnamed protein product [Bursaphelenchus xylophilus]
MGEKAEKTKTKNKDAKTQLSVGVPTDQELNAPTLQDDADDQLPSERTENELSDISEEGYKQFLRQETTTKFGAVFSPVIVNPYLRRLAVLNALSWAITIGFCGFVLFQVISIWYGHAAVHHHNELDLPCMFDWLEWGPCSASCRNGPQFPVQTRHVDSKTIVRARGMYVETAPCPKNLETMSDNRSCNVHQCPKLLSTIQFRNDCVQFDGHSVQVRDLTIDDMETVTIDTPDLYRPCNSS